MGMFVLKNCAGLAVAGFLLRAECERICAESFKPATDSYVVEKLPSSLVALRRFRTTQSHLTESSDNLSIAREYLAIAQRTSDPAFVRYAEQILAPLQTSRNAEAIFLSAVISQHKHEFALALDQLALASRLAPQNGEIPLLRASILTTLGRFPEAKAIFANDLRLASTLRGLTIFLTTTSLNGGLAKSRETLERSINPRATAAEQSFAWSALGEMAVRQGDVEGAERFFRKALELEPADSYVLSAYADLLLGAGREKEVCELIDPRATSEALITRRFLAMKRSDDQVSAFAAQLVSSGHLRELAMLQLDLLNEPKSALESASKNWRNQKEPIDTILWLRAALAAGDPSAVRPVLDWLSQTKMEDSRILALFGRLQMIEARK